MISVTVIILAMILFGCGNSGDPTNLSSGNGPFKVQFEANGGLPAPNVQTIDKGGTVTPPPAMNFNHEDFKGWYTNSALTAPFTFTTPVTSDLKLYAKWGYKVGDTGPAGGKIFYVKTNTVHPEHKYYEASPAELANQSMVTGSYDDGLGGSAPASWYVVEAAKEEKESTIIGTGKTNTAAFLLIENFPQFGSDPIPEIPAVRSAVDYNGGGFHDWFLPSKAELQALLNSNVLTITQADHFYWSSSQCPGGYIDCVWSIQFGSSEPGHTNQENKEHDRAFVRPVRSFFCSHMPE